jgi:DNA modification methylase
MTPTWQSDCGCVVAFNADCLEVMPALAESSVDAVITDPPYHKEYVPLYGKMASHASRLLRDGGLLQTLCGHHSIDTIICEMRQSLQFYWIGGMPNKLGSVGRYHPRQMMCGWKPCLWFGKGKVGKHPYAFDMMSSKDDKSHHEWGQSLGWFSYYVEKMTAPDATILDPFAGAFTTAIAALMHGRRCVCIESDPEHFANGVARVQKYLDTRAELLVA